MTSEMKLWSQPQLIILARGTADESLTQQGCKHTSIGQKNWSGSAHGDCYKNNSDKTACIPCETMGTT